MLSQWSNRQSHGHPTLNRSEPVEVTSLWTTVGYGDKYPVTTEGRIIGSILMIAGVGMFATVSGLAASCFLGVQDRESNLLKVVLARLDILEAKLIERKDNERSNEREASQ